MSEGKIRIGIGGWTYPPWRGVFYPEKLPQAKELRICDEADGRDRDQRDLLRPAEAEELGSVGEGRSGRVPVRDQGLALLRDALETCRKRERHCELLRARDSQVLGPETRSDPLAVRRSAGSSTATTSRASSTCCRRAWTAFRSATQSSRGTKASATRSSSTFAGRATSPSCFEDSDEFPLIEADTADFAYARLQRMKEEIETGYDDAALDRFADRGRAWQAKGRRLHLHDQWREGESAGSCTSPAATSESKLLTQSSAPYVIVVVRVPV